jgi:hypothetical protein
MEPLKMKAFKHLRAASLMVLLVAAAPALADCSAELSQLRARLEQVKDEAKRQELTKLIEKAEKDHRNARAKLCTDAVTRAGTLLK